MADLDPADQAQPVADVRDENGTPVIWLSGELDMTSVPQVRAAIDAALASHPDRVILDASSLEYMDSSGIALLARMASKAREVQVRNPTPIVRRLIELTGLSQILRIVS
jgi:anti-sigma B factor antagonist